MGFITDKGEIDVNGYIPMPVKNMLTVIKTIGKGDFRKSAWVARKANCEASCSKFLTHPLLRPYRIKCCVDGIQSVWFGSAKDIKAKKAEFTKEGKDFQN